MKRKLQSIVAVVLAIMMCMKVDYISATASTGDVSGSDISTGDVSGSDVSSGDISGGDLTYARFEAEGCQFLVDESVTVADVRTDIANLKDDYIEKMDKNIFEGVSDEDKKNMLSLVWCNQPVAPDCTLTLKDMTSGQKAECMKLLSEKISDSDNQNDAYLYSLFNEYEPY